MRFARHLDLAGQHAYLSPSNYHWINYDDEKLDRVFTARMAAGRGTDLHAFAHEAIRLRVKLPKNKHTLSLYVNDAIGYRMQSEVVLYYSENAFGTADTISFHRGKLRIHELKTGQFRCSVHQLEVYAALFCLEYKYDPREIEIELRIYQSNEVEIFEGDPEEIKRIMETIIRFDKRLDELKEEVLA